MFLSLFLCPPIRRLHHNFGYPSYKGCPTPANTTEIREKKILCTLTNADALGHEWLAPASKRNVEKEMCEKGWVETREKKKKEKSGIKPAIFRRPRKSSKHEGVIKLQGW